MPSPETQLEGIFVIKPDMSEAFRIIEGQASNPLRGVFCHFIGQENEGEIIIEETVSASPFGLTRMQNEKEITSLMENMCSADFVTIEDVTA